MVLRVAAARDPKALAVWRMAWALIASVIIAAAAHPAVIAALTRFWLWARETWVVKHESFEPMEATFAFAFWINVWRAVDVFCPGLHKWKLHGPPQQQREFKNQSSLIYLLKPGVSNMAAFAYLLPLLTIDLFRPLPLFPCKKLPLEAPSPIQLISGVCVSVWAYDLLFFFVHLSMHKVPWIYRNVHAKHHNQVALASHEVIHHSFIDGSFQVMANVLVLRTLGLHPMTRALHNICVTYLLTETHSGYDMPWMLHNVLPHGILGGSPAHEEHHNGGKRHYQQFFLYLDYFIGAVDKELSLIHI